MALCVYQICFTALGYIDQKDLNTRASRCRNKQTIEHPDTFNQLTSGRSEARSWSSRSGAVRLQDSPELLLHDPAPDLSTWKGLRDASTTALHRGLLVQSVPHYGDDSCKMTAWLWWLCLVDVVGWFIGSMLRKLSKPELPVQGNTYVPIRFACFASKELNVLTLLLLICSFIITVSPRNKWGLGLQSGHPTLQRCSCLRQAGHLPLVELCRFGPEAFGQGGGKK